MSQFENESDDQSPAANKLVRDLKRDQDRKVGEAAEREAEAQLAIIRALKPLDKAGRARVIEAVGYILEAEKRVPGVLAACLSGLKPKK